MTDVLSYYPPGNTCLEFHSVPWNQDVCIFVGCFNPIQTFMQGDYISIKII